MIYEIAGLRIQLNNRCNYTNAFCKGYLSDDQTSPPDMVAGVTKEEFLAEKQASPAYSDGYLENICLYRSLCLNLPVRNRFLMHSAVVEYAGNGYAFLGRSGAGKSTHTGLWVKYLPVEILNGDKPILQYEKGEFLVHGTPWMGKEALGKRGVAPLKGLCFVEKAQENKIERLSPKETAGRLFPQLLMPKEEENAVKTLELADTLLATVPAYLLHCNISEEAVKTSFEQMTGDCYESVKRGKL